VSIGGLAFAYGFEYGYVDLISGSQCYDIAHYDSSMFGGKAFGQNVAFNKA
jgi:hypothetical protein